MASPLNRRRPEPEELDIDALFASEPEPASEPPRPDAPKLIFTQPADRNVQQFADESVHFAEEAEADPLSMPLLPAPALPYHAQWNEPGPPRRRAGLFLAVAALVGSLAVVGVQLLPWSNERDLSTSASPPPERTAAPTAMETPPASRAAAPPAADEQPSDAGAGAPAPVARVNTPEAPTAARAPETPRTVSREVPKTAATSGRAANTEPPISTRGVSSAPAAAAGPVVPPATPDVRRLTADSPIPLGQPLPPPREVVPTAALHDAAPAPRLEPAPPPVAAAPAASAPAPAPVVDPRVVETDRVRAVLSGFERAYSALDADAASRVYPAVDRKALARAFSGLSAQQIQFNDCRIQVLQGSARATCAGTARWTPKVGGGSRQQARRWDFDLQQVPGGWRIGAVKVQ